MKKEFTISEIAKIAHEVNRAYCRAIGDNSQVAWEDAPTWQKLSACIGVDFHLDNVATPEQSHDAWMAQKADDGWKYGPVKDAEKKEHPCFVKYSELPQEQRIKDHLFKAVCESAKSSL